MIIAWTILTLVCFIGSVVMVILCVRDLIRCRWNIRAGICIPLLGMIVVGWVEVGKEMAKFFI